MAEETVIGPESPLPRMRVGWVIMGVSGILGLVVSMTLAYAQFVSRSDRMEAVVGELGTMMKEGLREVRQETVTELREIKQELKRQDGDSHARGKQLGVLEERMAHLDARIRRIEEKRDGK